MPISIRPIGTNAAFTLRGFNSNYIIEGPSGRFLFDCGGTAPVALDRLGLAISDFSEVFISHLHLDHVGGLIQLALLRYNAGLGPVRVFAHRELAEQLWPGFLQSFLGRAIGRNGTPQRFEAEDLFQFVPLPDPDESFSHQTVIGGIRCRLFRGEHPAMSLCHGLVLNERVLMTSDTTFQPDALERVANSFPLEAIFHHCTFSNSLKNMHATVEQLRTLPEDLRQLIILSHYDDHMTGKTDPDFELAETGKVYRYSPPIASR